MNEGNVEVYYIYIHPTKYSFFSSSLLGVLILIFSRTETESILEVILGDFKVIIF